MMVHYGYRDAQGDFRISVDTDKCSGCGLCVEICPSQLFCLEEDDYDEVKAMVKQELINKIGILCLGGDICRKVDNLNCIDACTQSALSISF